MITEQQLTEWEELARAAGDDPLLNTICKAIANKSVGDPHAIDTHGNQRWTWFLEHADEFLALFKYRPEVALLAAVMTGAFSRTAIPALVERVKKLEAENDEMRRLLKPFACVADMEEKAGAADSVIVNVARCRDAREFLRRKP